MYRGRIVGTVSPSTSREEIGLLMAGITSEGADGAAAPTGTASPETGPAETGPAEEASDPGAAADDDTTQGPEEGRA
jgi:simple sugar transport system ATP-binding protein